MNRLVNAASLLLEPGERDAVLGDLEEAGEGGARALAGVFGLAARRQAAEWKNWRPWLALAGLAMPLGLLLCLVARRVADGSAIHLWLYANNWDWDQLRVAGARRELGLQAVALGLSYLTLACWSWSGGLALRWVSRRAIAVNGVVFAVLLFAGAMVGPPPKHFGMALFFTARDFRANGAVFQGLFYRSVLTPLVQTSLVMAPAICGMRTRVGGMACAAAAAALAALLLQAGLAPPVLRNLQVLRFIPLLPVGFWIVNAARKRREGNA